MKRINALARFFIAAIVSILVLSLVITSCSHNKHMKYYRKDVRRGLAH